MLTWVGAVGGGVGGGGGGDGGGGGRTGRRNRRCLVVGCFCLFLVVCGYW